MRSARALWSAVVGGQAMPLMGWTLGPLLTALAVPYDWGHRWRLWAYRRGWLSVKRLPCHVISIGNLTVGGTGKTPMVEATAALLGRYGYRVGVLSRGYGRRSREVITVVSSGQPCVVPAEVAGDEPVLLAEHLPGVPVVVGRDRYAAGMRAVQRFAVDVLILDDGFQHVQLARDLDIVLLDAAQPLGSGRLLPRGDLREGSAALARADMVVLTRWAPGLPGRSLPQSLPPVFRSRHEPRGLRVLHGGQPLALEALNGRRVLAFCGIGRPASFAAMLQQCGADVAGLLAFPDHHVYTLADLDAVTRMARRCAAEVLVTTEKDGIRLRQLPPFASPVWELQIGIAIVDQQTTWEACVLATLGEPVGQAYAGMGAGDGPRC